MTSNKINKTIKWIGIFAITLIIASCKKDKTNPTTEVPKGTLVLHIHSNIDTSEIEAYDSVYTNNDGRKLSLSLAQIYLSHIKVVKLDGTEIEIENSKILKTLDAEEIVIGSVPVGNYKTVKFNIGFDATENQVLPTSNSILNHSEMWFGSTFTTNDGYVFAHLSGKIDTSISMNGNINQMQSFDYKIGKNNHYTSITMPEQNFSVTANLNQYIHLTIDYGKLLDGIDVTNSSNLNVKTISDNSTSLANKLAANLSKIFSYE
ncbi:MAG: hypothetical protein RIQ33_2594 [Bacteroidota bacterium]|jgi:hypothetical protein